MSVFIENGIWTTVWKNKKASTAFANNSLVGLYAGYVEPGVAASGAANRPLLGIYQGPAILAGSATTDLIAVLVPVSDNCRIRADVTASIAKTDEGEGFDLSTSLLVDSAAQTNKAVTLDTFVTATQGIFSINKRRTYNV